MKKFYYGFLCVFFISPGHILSMCRNDATDKLIKNDLTVFLNSLIHKCDSIYMNDTKKERETELSRKKFYEQQMQSNDDLKKDYHDKLKEQRESEWDYFFYRKISASEKLQRKEEQICHLLDKACMQEKNKNKIKKIIIASEPGGILERTILELLYGFSTEIAEDPGAMIKSFILLNQFPKIRRRIFCYRFKNVLFNSFINSLKMRNDVRISYPCKFNFPSNERIDYPVEFPNGVAKVLASLKKRQ